MQCNQDRETLEDGIEDFVESKNQLVQLACQGKIIPDRSKASNDVRG